MATIVTNPTASDTHVNVPLTNFSQKYLQEQTSFIATRAFPNVPVAKQSDLYYEFDRDDFYRDEAAERADGAESQGGSFTLSTSPYFTRVYSFHKDVTDRQRANQDSPVKLDMSASQFVTHKLLIRRERIFQDTYMKTGVWATDEAKVWSGATSDPIVDIRKGRSSVQRNTGYKPNKMIIGRDALDILMDNDAVLSRISGGATADNPAQTNLSRLAGLFELEQIFVMEAVYTSSAKGAATQTRQFVNANNALLYYAPDSIGLEEPTAGVQFGWTGLLGNTPNGLRIKSFRMKQNEADRIEGDMAFDYKVTGADLGHFFTIS